METTDWPAMPAETPQQMADDYPPPGPTEAPTSVSVLDPIVNVSQLSPTDSTNSRPFKANY